MIVYNHAPALNQTHDDIRVAPEQLSEIRRRHDSFGILCVQEKRSARLDVWTSQADHLERHLERIII